APDGPSMGSIGNEYTFTATTTDPEGEDVSYKFDWGEGNYTDWIGPVASGTPGSAAYTYTKPGDYTIRVKAKDINGGESGWSNGHDISIADAPAPVVEWIKGGLFFVTASVKNAGGVAATNVTYTITLSGGAFIGKDTAGTIAILDPGVGQVVKSKFILGFGATTITVTAGSSMKTADGKVLLFFIKLL
ncbi:MAG: PKD domain-containing protein, partial [Candidatus Thermoplasmatota archaeon]|nr:PKD domain-containing protein [Candidatus Thermoplasmatota archaeon]